MFRIWVFMPAGLTMVTPLITATALSEIFEEWSQQSYEFVIYEG